MLTATLAPTAAPPARSPLTAKQAVEARDLLRADGWRPLETATDWRATPVGRDVVGARRTLVYVPEFKNLLGGAIAWWKAGEHTAPAEAVYTEVYEVATVGHAAPRWTLV